MYQDYNTVLKTLCENVCFCLLVQYCESLRGPLWRQTREAVKFEKQDPDVFLKAFSRQLTSFKFEFSIIDFLYLALIG